MSFIILVIELPEVILELPKTKFFTILRYFNRFSAKEIKVQ